MSKGEKRVNYGYEPVSEGEKRVNYGYEPVSEGEKKLNYGFDNLEKYIKCSLQYSKLQIMQLKYIKIVSIHDLF